MKTRVAAAVLAALVGAAPCALALDAFVGARLVTVGAGTIDDGVLLVEDGRIVAVGGRDEVAVPAGAARRDVSGLVIMPGLVDTHSHIGRPEGGDGSAPIQPAARVLDSVDVLSAAFRRARAGGVTTVNVMPGSGHLMSGQTIYLKLRDGGAIEDLVIRDERGRPRGGMKMANGTNSRRDAPFPGTRAKSAALVRQAFVDALEYRSRREHEGAAESERPGRDLGMEALLEVLDGTRVVHHHTHRHDDILTVLRLREEFGFRVVLHHVSDAWKVADRLAAAGIPCSIILVDSPGGKLEAQDIALENGAALERAGVPVAFHTDDGITDSRLFLRMAAMGVRAGMTRDGALAAVTLAAAEMLDLGDRVGSLEAGKDADFVVLSGDPLSVYTRVLETWVEGTKVFDREDDDDRLYAEGGFGAGDPRAADLDCFDAEASP